MTTTKAELERSYVTVDGIIRSPGKFEGEPIWAPYFYFGAGEYGFADFDGGEGKLAFILSAEDRAEFPDAFKPDTYAVSLWESEQGFVYSSQLTRAEYEQLEAGDEEPGFCPRHGDRPGMQEAPGVRCNGASAACHSK